MSLMIQLLVFSVSILVLAKSGHIVIKSSIKIAKLTKLGELVIGFILLSVATSLPELIVSGNAIVSGNVGISIGNILGSNVANICLVIGLVGFLKTVKVTEKTLKRLSIMLFLSSLVLVGLLVLKGVSRFVGVVLLMLFGVFCLYSMKRNINLKEIRLKEPKEVLKKVGVVFKFYKTIFNLCVGLLGIFVASKFVVDSASSIALILGIPQSVIGATIIAIGTSLPELTTALTAVKEGHVNLGLGTTIGSCLTNLTLVLGFVLILSSFTVNMTVFTMMIVFVLASSLLLWLFLSRFGRKRLDRFEGGVLLFVYVIFLVMMAYSFV